MKIITSGKPYLDIDAYASAIAYAELFGLQNQPAIPVSTSQLNGSISPTVRVWGAPLSIMYNPTKDDTFILVDVSDPDALDDLVIMNQIEQVIDHHTGFETFWREKIGDAADIEFIGAACTLIYERWIRAGMFEKISEMSARLLLTGILDNTLNFKAQITTQRDKDAYEQLFAKANLAETWPAQYFAECQQAIEKDLGSAIRNDVGKIDFPFLRQPIRFAQLTVWDANALLAKRKDEVVKVLDDIYDSWVINIISIAEGKNYILSRNPQVQESFSKLLGVQFSDNLANTSRLWLRKEIRKAAHE